MLLFLLLNSNCVELLPSPTYLVALVCKRDFPRYQSELARARSSILRYSKLSEKQQKELIIRWGRNIEHSHGKAARQLKPSNGFFKDPWYWLDMASSSVSDIDLTKIDVFLAVTKKPPLFHLNSELKRIYQIDKSWLEPLGIATKSIPIPGGLQATAGGVEAWLPSFDRFFTLESKSVFKWIARNMNNPRPAPMTEDLMLSKVAKY